MWVLLSLYLCASAGTPPLLEVWLPDRAACERVLTVLNRDKIRGFDPVPGRLVCRSAEATREAVPCDRGIMTTEEKR